MAKAKIAQSDFSSFLLEITVIVLECSSLFFFLSEVYFECHKTLKGFNESQGGVSSVFYGSLKSVSRKLGSFKCVSRKFLGCFKEG